MEIDILVEPSRRDSGPAMAAAAAYTRSLGAKAVLALASDHLVIGAEEFRAACREGLAAVEKGGIVTFGIPPTEPKTDYGYIRPGSEHIGPVQKVAAFVEKPNAQTALRYIAEGCCGTAATSCSARRCCCRRWRASSRPWRPPPRKPWPRPRRPARRCSSTPKPSPRRRPSRSTMPSWSAPTNAGWCRPSSAGPTSAPGTRCSMSATPTAPATSPRARSRSTMCAIPTSAPTGRSPP